LLQRLPASVVRRLHRERYRKPSWLTPIPDTHKLTEEDITTFVQSMMQPVLLAMFSKTGSLDAAQALQNLALMRPELITFQFIATFVTLVPLVDCSSAFHERTDLTEVTRVDGDKLIPYRSDLVQILQLTLHLKCKQGYILACNLLHHILRSTALIYPTEYCSVPGGFHQPVCDYLPIKVFWFTDYKCHYR
ncbi:hypothetical protein XENOCAPTIV_000731, partial [Xenoophorus captivus]